MKAQDFMSQDNNRAEQIRRIQAFCDANAYEYSYAGKKFSIVLVQPEPVPVHGFRLPRPFSRSKPTDTSNWGPPGPVEGEEELPDMPTELPPITQPLEEGEPPKGDEEK